MSRSVVITGATAGIGRATALALARQGWHVFATGRREAELASLVAEAPAGSVTPIRLDVTDDASVTAMAAAVDQATGGRGVDALINNAGYGQMGAVLDVSDAAVRAQFETNVHGLLRVTRALVPAMVRRGEGRVINVSSVGGRVTFPLAGVYHASKYAVEALSDAMRMELAGHGVAVSLLEPGGIRTEFGQVAVGSLSATPADGTPWSASRALADRLIATYERWAPGPEAVLPAIHHALTATRPRARYVAPGWYGLILGTLTSLPTRLLDVALRRAFGLVARRDAALSAVEAA